jgi:hypothetical protein
MISIRKMFVFGLMMSGAATAVQASTTLPIIDDFSTGPVTITFNGATQTTDLVKTVTEKGSTILRGERQTSFELSLAGNPFLLDAEFKINGATATAPAALTTAAGFQMSSRIDINYGNYVNKPLNVNLTPYDRFRVHFLALDGDQDIVIQTFAPGGDGQWGCSLAASPYHPVVVDMPFVNSPGASFSGISQISVISQGGAYGYETGIGLIEVVKKGTPNGDVTCAPISNAIVSRLGNRGSTPR